MQKIGTCGNCHSPYRQMVYNAVDPETGKLTQVCQRCERAWAEQRERPADGYDYHSTTTLSYDTAQGYRG